MAEHNLLGKEGERRAEAYLTSLGYRIRERNWRSSHLELDLVAEHDGWLVVVEVKTRTGRDWEPPEYAVTPVKIRRIVAAAHHYVCYHKIDLPVRFDVISIVHDGDKWEIEHFPDAFLPIFKN